MTKSTRARYTPGFKRRWDAGVKLQEEGSARSKLRVIQRRLVAGSSQATEPTTVRG